MIKSRKRSGRHGRHGRHGKSGRHAQRGGYVRTSYVGHYPDGETGFSWLENEKITGLQQIPHSVKSLFPQVLSGGKNKKTRSNRRLKRKGSRKGSRKVKRKMSRKVNRKK